MMIELRNVSKKYQDFIVFEKVNLVFKSGLIGIKGNSGEGKSTLLNIIASLDENYDGEIYFEGVDYKKIKDKEKFRFNNIGFVFQNYQLFNLMTVQENIAYYLNIDDKVKIKINQVLKKVHLNVALNQQVNTLSGGEKQRLAIARALFKGARVLLCDEPTGALDHQSKRDIMSLLKEISQEILVIVVSHEDILDQYADEIILIKDKRAMVIKKSSLKENKLKTNALNNRLSLKMMFKYSLNNLRSKKIRSLISYFSISLGLLCLGISISLTSMASTYINQCLISEFDNDKVLITNKEKNELYNEIYSVEKEVLDNIYQDYQEKILGIGTFYFSDFENQLIDQNYFTLNLQDYQIPFAELSFRSINEYEIITNQDILPNIPQELSDNEFVLSLREKDVKRIAQNLRLSSFDKYSLSNYLKNNSLKMSFYCENKEWDYQTKIDFTCSHFFISDELKIYHTSYFFNETIFEKQMKFKCSNDLLSLSYLPWTLKKVYYFHLRQNDSDKVINSLLNNEKYNDFYFDYIDKNNSKNLDLINYRRIYVTRQAKKRMNLSNLIKVLKEEQLSYFFSNDNTYYVFDELLLNSFMSTTFLLPNEEETVSLIDELSISEEDISSMEFSNLVCGSLAGLVNENNLRFDNYQQIKNLYGRNPLNYQEIVISKRIAEDLFPNVEMKDLLNQKIYFVNHRKSVLEKNLYHNYFDYCQLEIVGISEEDYRVIYGDEEWTTFFYVENFSYSLSESMMSKVVLHLEGDKQEKIEHLQSKLEDFVILDPLTTINQQIEEVLSYVDFILVILSFVTTISAILMNLVTVYLFVNENKKEIALMKALGVSKFSLMILLIVFTCLIGGISLINSGIILLISNLLLSYQLSGTFLLFTITSYLKSSLAMFFLSSLTSLIIGLMMSIPLFKYPVLEILKEK